MLSLWPDINTSDSMPVYDNVLVFNTVPLLQSTPVIVIGPVPRYSSLKFSAPLLFIIGFVIENPGEDIADIRLPVS